MMPCMKPRFIVTTLVIAGIMLAAVPLLHQIGPSQLLGEEQVKGESRNVLKCVV